MDISMYVHTSTRTYMQKIWVDSKYLSEEIMGLPPLYWTNLVALLGIKKVCFPFLLENKVLLSVSNMNLLILDVSTRRSSSAIYMRNGNTSQFK